MLEIIAAATALLVALKNQKTKGVGMIEPFVNNRFDGARIYEVGIWQGSGYYVDLFKAYADSEEEALEYVVAYIEQNNIQRLLADEYAARLYEEGGDDLVDIYTIYVDPTMVGGNRPHYILSENLRIREVGKSTDVSGVRYFNSALAKDNDGYGEDEMQAVKLKDIDAKSDPYFKLQPTDTAPVYVKGEYDRSEKKYWCEKYNGTGGRYIKGDKIVYVGFYF